MDWEKLKQIVLELNEELADLFEEIRVLVKKDLDLPYWCVHYSGDEPAEYLCPTAFVRAIYEEVYVRFKLDRKQFIGSGRIETANYGDKTIFHFKWRRTTLARSSEEGIMKKAQSLFSRFIEDEGYRVRIKDFMAKQEETYGVALEKVKQDIRDVINSIELGKKIIKGKCQHCP